MSKRKGAKRRGFRMRPDPGKRVAILVPSDDQVKTEFATSLVNMIQHTYHEPALKSVMEACVVQFFGSSILPFSREQLAKFAIASNATHTLWIDSDMRFPKDMLLRFLRRDELIVGINAMSRREPYRCTAQTAPGEPLVTTADSSGLEKVHRMGFGVMWVATSVFKEMQNPWFDFNYVESKECWQGEDFAFFERARALGHPFYVDHDLSKEVFHMGSFGYNPMMMNELGTPAP